MDELDSALNELQQKLNALRLMEGWLRVHYVCTPGLRKSRTINEYSASLCLTRAFAGEII